MIVCMDGLHYTVSHGCQPSARTCSCPQPATVSEISCTVTPFSIFISWSAPSAPDCNQCEYEYVLYYMYDKTANSITMKETEFVLTDLQPGTSVQLIVWPKCGEVLGNPEMVSKRTSKSATLVNTAHTCLSCMFMYLPSDHVPHIAVLVAV